MYAHNFNNGVFQHLSKFSGPTSLDHLRRNGSDWIKALHLCHLLRAPFVIQTKPAQSLEKSEHGWKRHFETAQKDSQRLLRRKSDIS
jgi:hypothetical protein